MLCRPVIGDHYIEEHELGCAFEVPLDSDEPKQYYLPTTIEDAVYDHLCEDSTAYADPKYRYDTVFVLPVFMSYPPGAHPDTETIYTEYLRTTFKEWESPTPRHVLRDLPFNRYSMDFHTGILYYKQASYDFSLYAQIVANALCEIARFTTIHNVVIPYDPTFCVLNDFLYFARSLPTVTLYCPEGLCTVRPNIIVAA